MTREEAIEWMQEEKARFERAPDLNGCPMTECWQKAIDVYDMAISALRQRDVTDKDVGKNEPLTLDELWKMDNQPVWIEDVGEYKWHGSGWAIVDREYCLVRKASNGNPAFFERYGKEWIAYRQKPEEGTV